MHCVVLVTVGSKEEAVKISNHLLDDKLAACVNIVEGIESLFWWEGKKDTAREALLLIKTKKDLIEKLILTVKNCHSYDNPEIIALPIIDGSPNYMKWIDKSLS